SRGRDHGPPACEFAHRGCSVPSRVDPYGRGHAAPRQLAGAAHSAEEDRGECTVITFARVFEEIAAPAGPSGTTVRAAFDAILAAEWTPVQVAGFAVALRLRGETPEVLQAAVESLRAVMIPVEHGLPVVVDTCGTGGDGLGTLNISTAA